MTQHNSKFYTGLAEKSIQRAYESDIETGEASYHNMQALVYASLAQTEAIKEAALDLTQIETYLEVLVKTIDGLKLRG